MCSFPLQSCVSRTSIFPPGSGLSGSACFDLNHRVAWLAYSQRIPSLAELAFSQRILSLADLPFLNGFPASPICLFSTDSRPCRSAFSQRIPGLADLPVPDCIAGSAGCMGPWSMASFLIGPNSND
ncbi:MAG: hypothetical protein CMF59_17960 [Leptospiraceae bacterium]|nr:hypothetical protein [Leptospiraceae bacterium]